jgi:fucose permease
LLRVHPPQIRLLEIQCGASLASILYNKSMGIAGASPTGSALSSTKAANAAFVPIGIVTVLLGPLLPILSARWSLNYEQAGSLFTAQFFASTIGVGISGFMVSRWGFRFAINAGLIALSAGVGGLAFSPHLAGLICIGCYGLGIGFAVPAANLLVSSVNPDQRSAALNRLNFWWSVGSVSCPFLLAAAARLNQSRLFLVGVAVFMVAMVLRIAALPSLEPPARSQKNGNSSPTSWTWRPLLIFAALFFLYVGTENSFGGWIASYAKSLGTFSPTWSFMTPSFFYAALMAGRWIAPALLRRVDEVKIARAGLILAFVGMVGLIFSRTVPPVICSVIFAGLGLAAVYPITIARLSEVFGASANRAGSVMFTVANLGGASMPWLVGYCSNRFNDLGIGLAVPVLAAGCMFMLYHLQPRNLAVS